VCDIAYELRRERHERAVLAVAPQTNNPLAFIDQQMRIFDAALDADPKNSGAALVERRVSELLEEAV
jgi:hypothetical protein